jgi:hypothetical protein
VSKRRNKRNKATNQKRSITFDNEISQNRIVQLPNEPDNNQDCAEQPTARRLVTTKNANPHSPEKAKPAEKRKHSWLEKFAVFFAALAFMASSYQGWVARDTEKRQLRA